ncbi:XdhC/CoxI family protein [bacterium]|nr:XdhC/CoxI family protein [bacterium]
MIDIHDSDPGRLICEAAERLERRENFAMVTIVSVSGSTPRKPGSRMLVSPNGSIIGSVGGGAVDKLSIKAALKALNTGNTEFIELNFDSEEESRTGMICGGKVKVLIEPFGAGPKLFLFGAGHVGHATARLIVDIGFDLTVLDSRKEWANTERFPASAIKVDKIEKLSEELITTDRDFILVMTHSHNEDFKAVIRLLKKPFYYLGVIGSPSKAADIRKRLAQEGFTKEEIARITCPIGIKIGSHTPAEIAVSVAAQLIELRNKWEKDIIG